MKVLKPDYRRVNPGALAVNEQSDFTRRIPAVSDKQQARVEKLVKQLVQAYDVEHNPEKAKDIFFKKAKLLSNPHYWEILRTVWVAAGRTDNANEFMPFFRSSRPCKGWFMTPEDSQTLEEMDWPITVYRAYDEEPDPGISWTTDKEWCEDYARVAGRKIKQRTVERSQVFAYISRRGESEIIILDREGGEPCR